MKLIRSYVHLLAQRIAQRPPLQPRQRLALGAAGLVVVLFLAVFWFAGRPILELASDPDRFRGWIAERGWWGQLALVKLETVSRYPQFLSLEIRSFVFFPLTASIRFPQLGHFLFVRFS